MFGFIPECRSDSLRNERSASPESPIQTQIGCNAVLDGEIVCLDENGCSKFYDLLSRRGGHAIYYAFDLLCLDGRDLRSLPLIERKRLLRSILPEQSSVTLYADHIERNGKEFYRLVCERDLEGVVAKLRHGHYGEQWFKIRNPNYSQYQGRHEMFEKKRGAAVGG